jgi:hypothetical protein
MHGQFIMLRAEGCTCVSPADFFAGWGHASFEQRILELTLGSGFDHFP